MRKLEYYKRRYEKAYSIATLWYSDLQECQHFCIPYRNLFYYTNQNQGTIKNAVVYDTTAVAATRNFVSKIHRALTPPQQVWGVLQSGTQFTDEKEKEQVDLYLQHANKLIFDYLRNSNFDLAVNECYYDLAVGTAVLVVNEGPEERPFIFLSIPLAQVAFEESINGYIESCYRTWGEVKISEIQIMWPNVVLPESLLSRLKQDPNSTVSNLYEGVIYCHGEKLPYKYVLWIDDMILTEDGYLHSPWIIFRWNKANNETNGRGPIQDAMPAVKSLNELFRLEYASANLNAAGVYIAASDDIFNPNTFRIRPNTIIPMMPGPDGVSFPIQPLPPAGLPQFAQVMANELRQQINTLMFANPLGNINDIPEKTATEMTLRQQNQLEELGPIFTRLQQEFLGRLFQRLIDILKNKGLLADLVINGQTVQLKYQSPLVNAQGQQDVQTFMNLVMTLQGIYGPDAARYLNPVNTPPWLGEKLGVDKELMLTKEEIAESFKQQSQTQQRLLEMEEEKVYGTAAR